MEDKDFIEAKFKTYVDNVFVKLHIGVMKGNLDSVKHFISQNVLEQYGEKIKELNSSNEIQMFDELNVAATEIESMEETDEKYIIKVCIKSKYMDYKISKDTRKYVSGDNTRRIEKIYYLTFTKKKNTFSNGEARKCPSCGANMDVNSSGKCAYCGSIYNQEDYEYILDEIN